jgi:hypothetical protein
MSEDRHDNFVGKNAALSRAYELDRMDKIKTKVSAGSGHIEGECEVCKKKGLVTTYRMPRTDRNEGVASFGYESKKLCDDCKPKPKKETPTLDKKAIRSLMRGAKKGRI